MLSKNETKYIQSLYHKKQRDALNLFIVEGVKGVDELLGSDFTVQKIIATNEWEHPMMQQLPVQRVTESQLQQVSGLQKAHQVLAIVEQKSVEAQPPAKSAITLVLDDIQDPGNMGTLIRIADWFGISQIIASEHSVELYNPKVIQSTMGSFIRVQVGYGSLEALLSQSTVPIYGALLEGGSIYQEPSIKEGVLIIGNESKGIQASLKSLITKPVSIPRVGGAESLNAGVAAGIILSHLIHKG
jgi:TrmH family RNA methyltransferase